MVQIQRVLSSTQVPPTFVCLYVMASGLVMRHTTQFGRIFWRFTQSREKRCTILANPSVLR